MKQHTLWIEKYRSQTLQQYIGNDAIKARIADCIANNDIPHLIFAGSAGTGKTTLAKLIVKNIQCDYLYINASDENGIDTIRDKVKGFASTASFQPIKIITISFIRMINSTTYIYPIVTVCCSNDHFSCHSGNTTCHSNIVT